MHLSENEGIEGKTFVVTGGLGYVGSALCFELLRRGAFQVRSLDCRTHSPWSRLLSDRGAVCIHGDITSKNDVGKALKGADCVFHLASYGMSGKEMIQVGRVDQVNINGTCRIIEACIESGISRLVYVSTYNVVFGGDEILNGNETLPFFPIDQHVDSYDRSKSIAEQLVLRSNGRPLREKNGKCLYTCAIRPAAIYGPGSPVNSFEFLRPLLRSLEYDMPNFSLSVPRALLLGKIFYAFYTMLYPWLNKWWIPQPFILPAEVYKVGVTHYFSLLKAKQELGYIPMVSPKEGMDATISYWQDRKRRSLDGPTLPVWLFSIIGMVSLFAVAYLPLPDAVPFSTLRAFSFLVFRSIETIRLVFVVSASLHVGEAAYAWHLARKVDPENARGWFWQTFALGFFSLRFLLKRSRTQP